MKRTATRSNSDLKPVSHSGVDHMQFPDLLLKRGAFLQSDSGELGRQGGLFPNPRAAGPLLPIGSPESAPSARRIANHWQPRSRGVEVVVIVGLPGSGKTRLIQEFKARGYQCFDDMNQNWECTTARMVQLIKEQRDIACSDIMFCTRFFRRRLERILGVPLRWIFFENNPWQCAKNSLYRHIFEEDDRPLLEEINMIGRLSRLYAPHGDVRPVVIAETQGVLHFSKAKIKARAPAELPLPQKEAGGKRAGKGPEKAGNEEPEKRTQPISKV